MEEKKIKYKFEIPNNGVWIKDISPDLERARTFYNNILQTFPTFRLIQR